MQLFWVRSVASPGQSLANHWKDGTHSVELRLKKAQLPSAGSIPTRDPSQVTTFSGRIRVKVCGSAPDLPSELQVIVEAAGPKGFIDVEVV